MIQDTDGNQEYEVSLSATQNAWSGTQQLGTSSGDSIINPDGVTLDSSGSIYVVTYTKGGLDNNINLGSTDIFLLKYNSSGVKQWTRQLGTSDQDRGEDGGKHRVTVDSLDNIYVTGSTRGGLDGNTNMSGRSWDFFLVKYNSSGVKQWTKQFGTTAHDFGYGVTVDSSDNLYVTGKTTGGMGSNTNSGGYDIFLVKYNSSGVELWAQQLGTDTDDEGTGVRVDSSDNIYVMGNTSGGLDNNVNPSASGGTSHGDKWDFFLVKYNSSGTKQWTQQLGTSSNDTAKGVVVDSSDNIYVTGVHQWRTCCPLHHWRT